MHNTDRCVGLNPCSFRLLPQLQSLIPYLSDQWLRGFGVLGMGTCELLQFHRCYWLVISAKRPVESELSISRTADRRLRSIFKKASLSRRFVHHRIDRWPSDDPLQTAVRLLRCSDAVRRGDQSAPFGIPRVSAHEHLRVAGHH